MGTNLSCETPDQTQKSSKKLKNHPCRANPELLEKNFKNTKNTRKIVFFEYF